MTVQTSVLHTLRYFNMFDFAPTLLEIRKWLLKHDEQAPQLHTIQQIAEQLDQIESKEGFYFLKGREGLIHTRKQKYNFTEEKWKHAKPHIRLLAAMPHVRAIWFVNSMGWHNARKQSDIDLCIITAPGKIWSARFFTTMAMKLLRQRPFEQTEERAICLSLYIAENQLDMEPYKIGEQDIHFSFWASQFYPIYDNGQFQQYIQQNTWLQKVFDDLQWTQPSLKRIITRSWWQPLIQMPLQLLCAESLLKRIQLKIMPEKLRSMANKDKRVVMNESILKLHTNDMRTELQKKWEEQIQSSTLT